MTDAPFPDRFFHSDMTSASRRLLVVGLALLALGIAAIVFPVASTLVATLMIGWMLLFFGCIALLGSFAVYGAGPFFGALLVALLAIAAGVFMLMNPTAAAAGITVATAILFVIQGAFEIAFALEVRRLRGWVSLLVSGILSVCVAVLIAAAWPDISRVLLGVLFGINFISTSVAYIIVSHELKELS